MITFDMSKGKIDQRVFWQIPLKSYCLK